MDLSSRFLFLYLIFNLLRSVSTSFANNPANDLTNNLPSDQTPLQINPPLILEQANLNPDCSTCSQFKSILNSMQSITQLIGSPEQTKTIQALIPETSTNEDNTYCSSCKTDLNSKPKNTSLVISIKTRINPKDLIKIKSESMDRPENFLRDDLDYSKSWTPSQIEELLANKIEPDKKDPNLLVQQVRPLYSNYFLSVRSEAYNQALSESVEQANSYFKKHPEARTDEILKMVLQSLQDKLNISVPNNKLFEDVYTSVHLQRAIQEKSFDSFIKRLAEIDPQLKPADATKYKLQSLQQLGSSLVNLYNDDLATNWLKTGPDSNSLLKSLQQNDPTLGGVCRQIALFQAKTAEGLGMKNTYIKAYNTSGTPHVVFFTQDPNDAKTVYKFNYGELTTARSSEGTGILKSHADDDISSDYYIFDTHGKPVTLIASDRLKTILEGHSYSDTQIKQIDPMIQLNSSILKTSIGNQDVRADVWVSRNSDGNTLLGIGPSFQHTSKNQLRETNGFLSYVSTLKDKDPKEKNANIAFDKKVHSIYLGVQHTEYSPWLKKDLFKTRFEETTDIHANLDVTHNIIKTKKSGDISSNSISGWMGIRQNVGFQTETQIPKSNTKITTDTKLQLYLSPQEVNQVSSIYKKFPITPNWTLLEVKIDQPINNKLLVSALLQTKSQFKGLGTNIKSVVAVDAKDKDGQKRTVYVGYQGALDPHTITITEGSVREIYTGTTVNFNKKNFSAEVGAQVNVPVNDPQMTNAQISTTINIIPPPKKKKEIINP